MRLEVLSDTALRQLEPARLMALIAHVQRFIDKAVAYQRRLIAVAESERAARAVGDACVADSLVRNTGMSRGAARRAARQAKTIADGGDLQCGNSDGGDLQCGNSDGGDLQCGNSDGGDADDVEWADYDNEGKRVVPVLRVSTSLDALRDGLHRAGITDSGESLSAATVRRLACDADIIPTVLNGKGRVIDVGRRTRRVSEALRCVLIARDGGCVWPGCDASPSRCDAHHIKHWADGGPTNADNLALMCHRHHTLLHEGRHRLERVGDAWVVLTPDGTRLHTPLAPAGRDMDIRHARPGAATSSSAPNRNLVGSLDTAPIPALNPGRRRAVVAPESNPTQMTLACHDRGEMTIRLTTTCQSGASSTPDQPWEGPGVVHDVLDFGAAAAASWSPPARPLRGDDLVARFC